MMNSSSVPSGARQASVLIVDDNAAARQTTGSVLRYLKMQVYEADTGAAAIAAIRARRFDLALIDFRLPDISGLDIVVALKKDRISVPWLLMSGRMTPPLAVEAMKLGALDAVELPFDVEHVVASALRQVASGWPRIPPPEFSSKPRSAAERWAYLVVRGCAAEHDLKTIKDWAAVAGVSYSVLTDICRLAGIRPHDARDFLRMLRVLSHAGGRVENLEHGLDVNDYRTLKALFERAGLTPSATGTISLNEFIDRQRFVSPASEAMRQLLTALSSAKLPVSNPV